MLQDDEVAGVWAWALATLDPLEFYDAVDGTSATNVAETMIMDCPLLDAEDTELWEADSGGPWDAGYIYALWCDEIVPWSQAVAAALSTPEPEPA